MNVKLAILLCTTTACALPVDVASEEVAGGGQTEALVAGPGRLPCGVVGGPNPGKPSCPECSFAPLGDDLYHVQISTSLSGAVYFGDPGEGNKALEVWSGPDDESDETVALLVHWTSSAGQRGAAQSTTNRSPVPLRGTPVPPLEPSLYQLDGRGCPVVLAPYNTALFPAPMDPLAPPL